MQYQIFIHKDENSAYGVIVPDLLGCYSAGDTVGVLAVVDVDISK